MLPDLRLFIAALLATVGFVFVGFALMATMRSAQVTTTMTPTPRSPVLERGASFGARAPAADKAAIPQQSSASTVLQQSSASTVLQQSSASAEAPSAAATVSAPHEAAQDQIGAPPSRDPSSRESASPLSDPPGRESASPEPNQSVTPTPQSVEQAAGAPPADASAGHPVSPADGDIPRTDPTIGNLIESGDVTGSVSAPAQKAESLEQKQPKARPAKHAKPRAAKKSRSRSRPAATPSTQQQGPFPFFQPQAATRQ